jgi:predicted RNase H-like HicB family nuclease
MIKSNAPPYNIIGGGDRVAKVKVLVHPAQEGGYWAEAPALEGCFTQGETLREIEENMEEAVALFLEGDAGGLRVRLIYEVLNPLEFDRFNLSGKPDS